MDTLKILKRAVQVIVFLFSAFGYFLQNAAPPSEIKAGFATGLASLTTFCLLLFISALAGSGRRVRHRKRWLGAAATLLVVAVAASIIYVDSLGQLTFEYPKEQPSGTYVAGYTYTPEAQEWVQKQRLSKPDVVAKFGGVQSRELVWTAPSLHKARMTLLFYYMLMVVGFSATIFCLTEGILVKRPPKHSQLATGE